MFEHSIKVPRHYKIAANIFKKVSTEGGSVKTLLYDNKLRHFRTNVLYALITETIKHAADIDKIFETCCLLEKESRLDPWLAKVLTAELLFGKKSLPGKSKPEQTILSYKDQFEKYTVDHQGTLKTEAIRRPRYVRINTNLLTTSDAIRAFQDEGYRFIRCTSGSYEDYLKQIQQLAEYDFTQDYHVKTVFVFTPGTKLHEHELYLENKIILQDKATAMAVHLLAPPPGSVALDLCAAPGMKTTQLAAYMRNQGRIYAVERNEKRYKTLCDFVEKTGSKCVETLNKDSLDIKRGELEDVEYILLDPSCSGSGMELCVHNYIEESRLAKLTSLQEKFLKHAMNAFPKVKRIVYSTCSLFPEENERVITNVVKTSRSKWRVQDVKELLKGQWNNIGSGMYGSMGTRCMYAKPDSDFTIGFFLAVLDRDEKDYEKRQSNIKCNTMENAEKNNSTEQTGSEERDIVSNYLTSKNKRKHKSNVDTNVNLISEENLPMDSKFSQDNFDNNETIIMKKKKKKKLKDNINVETVNENIDTIETKAKYKRMHESEVDNNVDLISEKNLPIDTKLSQDIYDNNEATIKKKKKRSKDNVNVETENENIDVVETKVKNKRKHVSEVGNNVDLISEENLPIDSKVSQNIYDNDEATIKKKKKKKKSKDNVNVQTENENIDAVETKELEEFQTGNNMRPDNKLNNSENEAFNESVRKKKMKKSKKQEVSD